MPAIERGGQRAEEAIRSVLELTPTVAPAEADHPIETVLSTLADEVEAAQERLDRVASLARNWMGMTDAHISVLIGVAPTTVARRDSERIRREVTEAVFDSRGVGR